MSNTNSEIAQVEVPLTPTDFDQKSYIGDTPSEAADASPILVKAADQKKKQSWLGRFWDTADLPPAERKLLFKVDASILLFMSLGYFLKNLDQNNINNAFLSGMKEELGMESNQLVTAVSIWTAGYCIFQIPALVLMTRVSPRWVIPAMEVGWGLMTLATYSVRSYKSLYVLRFFVGCFEAAFYPAAHYLLGSWYTPRELAKRASIFYISGSLGGMFSGYLQSAAYENLGGVALSGAPSGEGWRWLFIIDAVITLPIALAGFVFLPGLPWSKKPWWLTEEEIEIARARMKAVKRAEARPWTRQRVLALFKSWHLYCLPIAYMLYNNAIPQLITGYWLKSFNPSKGHAAPVPGVTYTVPQINNIPTIGTAVFIVLAMLYAWWSDALGGKRWPFILFGSVLNIIVNVVLLVTPLYEHRKRRLAFYSFTPAAGAIGALIMNMINEIVTDNNEARAVIIGAANNSAYVIQAIAPNWIWKTTEFPLAHKGHIWSISLSSFLIPWIGLILFLHNRDLRKRGVVDRRESGKTDIEEEGGEDREEKKVVQ